MKIQQHDGSIVEIEKSSKEAFEVLCAEMQEV